MIKTLGNGNKITMKGVNMLKTLNIWIFIIGMLIISIISCNMNNTSSSDTAIGKNNNFNKFIDYTEEVTENEIRTSSFCVAGKTHIKNTEVLKLIGNKDGTKSTRPFEWKVEGEIKVNTIVYGDPKTKKIPFSTVQRILKLTGTFAPETEPDPWEWLNLKEGNTFIVFGKGEGENITIIKSIKRANIAVFAESCKTIKNLLKFIFIYL